jgi:hypothetical protein
MNKVENDKNKQFSYGMTDSVIERIKTKDK